MKRIITVALTSLFLVACGKMLDGVYEHEMTGQKIIFNRSKVEVDGLGVFDYKMEDGYVVLKRDGINLVQLKIRDEYTLSMPMLGTFKKK